MEDKYFLLFTHHTRRLVFGIFSSSFPTFLLFPLPLAIYDSPRRTSVLSQRQRTTQQGRRRNIDAAYGRRDRSRPTTRPAVPFQLSGQVGSHNPHHQTTRRVKPPSRFRSQNVSDQVGRQQPYQWKQTTTVKSGKPVTRRIQT